MKAIPFVLKPSEGRAIDLGNFLMTVKADAHNTAGGFTLLEATEPPNFGPPSISIGMQQRRFMCWKANTSSSLISKRFGALQDPSFTVPLVRFTDFVSAKPPARN
jgi:hypothetical protein